MSTLARVDLSYEDLDPDFDSDPFAVDAGEWQDYSRSHTPYDPDHAGRWGPWDDIAAAWRSGNPEEADALLEASERGAGAPPLRTREAGWEPPVYPVSVSYMPCPDCGDPHHRKRPCSDAHVLAA